ncbi:MAG: cyclic nucleotide-binding domain-containing protein [Candidatus Omnitrophica bacterium]|nr:cyclic nucleotide-binding domain-containing protein [Candidatus Omnitrophota bacterium]
MDAKQIELLQNMAIFGGLRNDSLEWLLEKSQTRSIPQGEFFFKQEDEGGSMFVVLEGTLSIQKSWKGYGQEIKTLSTGDCFGEMSLIDLQPRSASVQAVEDCTVIEITSAILDELRQRDLEEFALIYMNMGREISRRLRVTSKRLFNAKMQGYLGAEELYYDV